MELLDTRVRGTRRPRAGLPAALLACAPALAAGCTSLQWQDDAGRTHHLGLLAARVETGDHGSRVDRHALGLDLRLSGEEPGLSLGWKEIESTAPRTIHAATPREFLDGVTAALAGREPPAPPRTSQWHLFYVVEDVTALATVHGSRSVGLEVVDGPAQGRLAAGYHATSALTGRAVEDDVAQIATMREGHPDSWQLTLWTLGSREPAPPAAHRRHSGSPDSRASSRGE